MAVLKSFELNGNKQSFANWISNLSPCETPFTSMIGKEGITQAQYSWQTDVLAPADNTVYEEGSLFEFQRRAKTTEYTNFTSILRKVVHVTETAEAIEKYGRGGELKYQMSKAGKEMMRDLEYMNLTSVDAGPGSSTIASSFAGFEGLVADVDVEDLDTGAVVHKKIDIAKNKNTCIDKNDIFDMTYNLYLAGSKANKIMFHPEHTVAFSMLIGGNSKEPLSYRMFDGVSSVHNAFVKTIRDPLGQVFELIPNRHMPLDKIYFFNESDWTQMVLRAPKASQISKAGSSTRYMVEMEVGLRHKNPFASGILTLDVKEISVAMAPPRSIFTAKVEDSALCSATVVIDGAAAKDQTVYFYSSDEDVVSFRDSELLTRANGRADNRLIAGDKVGIAKIWSVCRGVKSDEETIVTKDPSIVLTLSKDDPVVNETVQLSAAVKLHDGSAAKKDLSIRWYADEPSKVEFSSTDSLTDSTGTAIVNCKALSVETIFLQALFGKISSNMVAINYVQTAQKVKKPTAVTNTFKVGENVVVTTEVHDDFGAPIQGAQVHWNCLENVVSFVSSTTTTDVNGISSATITGFRKGLGHITASVDQITSDPETVYVGQGGVGKMEIDPNPTIVNEQTSFKVTVIGQDGSPAKDLDVTFWTNVVGDNIPGGTTDNHGVYQIDTVIFDSPGLRTIKCSGLDLGMEVEGELQVNVYDKQHMILHLDGVGSTVTAKVGDNFTARTTVLEPDGNPSSEGTIRFSITPLWVGSGVPDIPVDPQGGDHALLMRCDSPGIYNMKTYLVGTNPRVESNTVVLTVTA